MMTAGCLNHCAFVPLAKEQTLVCTKVMRVLYRRASLLPEAMDLHKERAGAQQYAGRSNLMHTATAAAGCTSDSVNMMRALECSRS
jgi:hypothetical protein